MAKMIVKDTVARVAWNKALPHPLAKGEEVEFLEEETPGDVAKQYVVVSHSGGAAKSIFLRDHFLTKEEYDASQVAAPEEEPSSSRVRKLPDDLVVIFEDEDEQ
jgi:hypothetical protein